MSGEHCPHCGHHRDNGCSFRCPDKRPPALAERYRAWAETQKLAYQQQETRNRA